MRNGKYELVVAPEGYPGKLYRGRYCYEHHLVYWRAHGVLPDPTQCIHHKNERTRDNRLENLELTDKKKHVSGHAKPKTFFELICAHCRKPFMRERRQVATKRKQGQRNFYCDPACSRKGPTEVGG